MNNIRFIVCILFCAIAGNSNTAQAGRGTLQELTNDEAHQLGAYIMDNDNTWYPAPANTPAANVPVYRCYLLQSGGTSNTIMQTILFENSITTGISVNTESQTTDGKWYTVDGRRIEGRHTSKGVYIVDGRKIIVK